jgi:hypothetical protein
MTLTGQQLADLNTELSRARTSQADAQAKAQIIRDLIKQGRTSELADIANNELVRRIAEQRVSVKAQLALESRTLLPGHPRIKELTAQLHDLDNELRQAADKTLRGLENEAKITGSRVVNLETALGRQKKLVSTANVDEVRLRELERQAQVFKDQLETSNAKYQEASTREHSQSTPADARIISRAVVPQLPSFPKKVPLLAFGTLASAILSLGVVVTRELFSGRAYVASMVIPSLQEMRSAPKAMTEENPPLDQPSADRDEKATSDGPISLLREPSTVIVADEPAISQSPKSLARQIQQAQAGEAIRIVATIQSNEGDGQETVLTLGRGLSHQGRSILVDFDGKLSTVSESSKQAEVFGLGDLLSGAASFDEAIQPDPFSRLHIIPVGKAELADQDFSLVIDALSETYDFVILFAPAPSRSKLGSAFAKDADFLVLAIGESALDTCESGAYAELSNSGGPKVMVVSSEDSSLPEIYKSVA